MFGEPKGERALKDSRNVLIIQSDQSRGTVPVEGVRIKKNIHYL